MSPPRLSARASSESSSARPSPLALLAPLPPKLAPAPAADRAPAVRGLVKPAVPAPAPAPTPAACPSSSTPMVSRRCFTSASSFETMDRLLAAPGAAADADAPAPAPPAVEARKPEADRLAEPVPPPPGRNGECNVDAAEPGRGRIGDPGAASAGRISMTPVGASIADEGKPDSAAAAWCLRSADMLRAATLEGDRIGRDSDRCELSSVTTAAPQAFFAAVDLRLEWSRNLFRIRCASISCNFWSVSLRMCRKRLSSSSLRYLADAVEPEVAASSAARTATLVVDIGAAAAPPGRDMLIQFKALPQSLAKYVQQEKRGAPAKPKVSPFKTHTRKPFHVV